MFNLNDDIVAQGLAELLSQFSGSTRLRGVAQVFLNELLKVELATYDLYQMRTLDSAQGEQLDIYGKIVDEPREGLDDFEYRRFLNVRLLVLNAQGEAGRLRRIVALAAQAVDVQYTNEPPASYALTYTVAAPLTDAVRARILRAVEAATASGVGFRIAEAIATVYFGFDEDSEALGFDDGELAEELG